MKTYILDTLNVIYKDPQLKNISLSSKDNAISALCSEISIYLKKYPSYKMILVIDGVVSNINKYNSNISLINSQDNTADDKIKELIQQYSSKKSLIIVSSDNEVYNFAKMNACDVIVSEKFLQIIKIKSPTINTKNNSKKNTTTSAKPRHTSKNEINEMSKLFKEAGDIEW